MKIAFYFFFTLIYASVNSQSIISGVVTDKLGNPISGANIYLKDTYDGSSSSVDGSFSVTTSETGVQTLIISSIGFERMEIQSEISQMRNLEIVLRDDVGSLDAVQLNAGSFSAGDNSRASVLKPLDVVTTAGVAGDFIAALQTLPGTQTVGEDGRLFVRGGTANETQIFIDGQRVFQPYTASANNIPARGRYSPFLFDGITFSTGGYSAEYGQALSSVLTLNTIREPEQNQTDISLMSVGFGLGHTKKWEKSSVSVNATYLNLAPYQELIPNNENFEFKKPYQSLAGETVFRKETESGLLKFYTALEHTNFELFQNSLDNGERFLTVIDNTNFYSNLSYFENMGSGWKIAPGLSFSHSKNNISPGDLNIENRELAGHLKLKATKKYSNRVKFNFGTEVFLENFKEFFSQSASDSYDLEINNNIFSAFAEADLIFSKSFALKPGIRFSRTFLNSQNRVAPRIAAAYKIGENSQFSIAAGDYSQQPLRNQLKFDTSLKPEEARHYIFNYQFAKAGYTLRAEAYYKKYENLIKYNTSTPQFESIFSNSGNGFARGADLFFRDDKSIKNLEYWFSYSFIDSKRHFQNYNGEYTPPFVANHSASLVTKYWIDNIQSQVGFSYNFSSGRPYENPNTPGFLNEKTRNYNNLSFNIAHLISQQKILYVSVSNILGTQNEFGYEYSNVRNSAGKFNERPITQTADRFFFVGFFWTISDNKESNQLDNL